MKFQLIKKSIFATFSTPIAQSRRQVHNGTFSGDLILYARHVKAEKICTKAETLQRKKRKYRSRCGKVRADILVQNRNENLEKVAIRRPKAIEGTNMSHKAIYLLEFTTGKTVSIEKKPIFHPNEKQKWRTSVKSCRWKTEIRPRKVIKKLEKLSTVSFYYILLNFRAVLIKFLSIVTWIPFSVTISRSS